ncbi:MAG: tetratricopeptide repeat protein [Bacteroidales bacterium]|nr:tetratricopeptide repeat protein [Bacteroidales bacterium]
MKKVLNTTNIDSVKLNAYVLLSNKLKYQHPDTSRWLFDEAIPFAVAKQHKLSLANLANNRGISYGVYQFNDSSIKYLLMAVDLFHEIDSTLPQYSAANNNLGLVYRQKGFYLLSIKHQLKALKIAENNNDTSKIASRLNNICATYFDMKDYDKAMSYAIDAKNVFNILPCSIHKINNFISLAAINEALNNLDTAYKYIQIAEIEAVKLNYLNGLPDIYSTKGTILKKQNKLNEALVCYNNSKNICDSINYSNFLFYPYWGFETTYRKKEIYDSAKFYFDKMLFWADSLDELPLKTIAYNEGYLLYKELNQYKKAIEYSELHKHFSDSLLNLKKLNQIEELNIIYETDKKNKQIKQQQTENELQQLQLISKQKTIWSTIISSLILFLAVVIFYFQRQKSLKQAHEKQLLKMQVETQDAIKQELASDLHSGAGSNLSSIILNLENKNSNEQLNEEIERLKNHYEVIRKKSHLLAIPTFIQTTIEEEINDVATSFSTDNQKINCNIFSKNGWKDIHPIIQQNIYRIVQELLTNTSKYANASEVDIQLTRHKTNISLIYEDNGVGYNPNEIKKGIGYKNEISTRVKTINGNFTDDSMVNQGTNLNFTIPINYEK